MPPVELVELVAEQVAAGGDAIARQSSGRVVFVHGALPGERVRARITDERADYARADVVDVLAPSPARRSPPCPFVAAGCGGCGWQHIDHATQAELKRSIVLEALRRTGRLVDPVVTAAPPLDPWGFRTTLKLGIDGGGRAGFRARRRHDLVAVDRCLVAHPLLDEVLRVARFPGATEVTLRCGAATGDRLAVVAGERPVVPVGLPGDVAFGPRAAIHEVVAGQRFRISARSFFQTRADGATALVQLVGEAIGQRGDGLLVDAYAGVGLFAATVGAGGPVVAVESSRVAVADARRNLTRRPARVVHAEVSRWRPVPADIVVADPARAGLGRPAVASLAGTGAHRLVLVSCDPVTLARDARLLAEHGYEHVRSTVLDLFPHTPHVEVVTRLELR